MSNTLSVLVRQLKHAYESISNAVFWLGLQTDRLWTWHEIARLVHREGYYRLSFDEYVNLRFAPAYIAA